MSTAPEFYTDQSNIGIGPYGAALVFGASVLPPAGPESAQSVPVVTVRMSVEHLKVFAYVLKRTVMQYEREMKISVDLPDKTLESVHVSRDDWRRFWSGE